MDNINLMEYWQNSSDEDYNVMNVLYNSKKIVILCFLDKWL